MSENKYDSRIKEPEDHATANGGSYVTAFDVVRSEKGRALINRHAEMAKSLGINKSSKGASLNGLKAKGSRAE